jgi:hypothetical protein
MKEVSRGGPRNEGEDVLSTLDVEMRKLRAGATRKMKNGKWRNQWQKWRFGKKIDLAYLVALAEIWGKGRPSEGFYNLYSSQVGASPSWLVWVRSDCMTFFFWKLTSFGAQLDDVFVNF